MSRGRAFVQTLTTFIIVVALVGFIWSFTGAPMMKNYAECGTIFLCANQ